MQSFFSYSSISTTFHSPSFPPPNSPKTIRIPIHTPPDPGLAAARIQRAYRSHLLRTLVRRVLAVDAEADRYERLLRRQETVDAVRGDERERVTLGEELMRALLRLDAVPGFYREVRELRRSVSRRIVGLQELLDAVVEERVVGLDGFPASLEEVVYGEENFERFLLG